MAVAHNVETEKENKENIVRFSDILKDDEFEKHLKENNAICYISGTGSGKSHWITNHLVPKGKVLAITSRRAKLDEDFDPKFYEWNLEKFKETDKSFLVTNHILSTFLKRQSLDKVREIADALLDTISYIVVDEIHSIICDSNFTNDVFMVQKFIEYAAFEKRKPVILLTATQQLIEDYLDNPIGKEGCSWKQVNYTKECINTLPNNIITVQHDFILNSLVPASINNKNKFIYFLKDDEEADNVKSICLMDVNSNIKGTRFVEESLLESEILYITSKARAKATTYAKKLLDDLNESKNEKDSNYTDEDVVEKLEFGYDEKNKKVTVKGIDAKGTKEKETELAILYLQKNSELPDNIKVLLATSVLKEGISIKNEDIKNVICYSHSLSDLIQYMGRVRKGNYTLYVIEDAQQFPIGINEIENKYAIEKEVIAANEFCTTLSSESEKREFIKYLEEKNQYIRYNFITNQFEYNLMLYRYHLCLSEIHESSQKVENRQNWQQDIFDFMQTYELNIPTFNINNNRKNCFNSYVCKKTLELLGNYGNTWLSSDEWKVCKKEIKVIFDITDSVFDKMRKKLEEVLSGTNIEISFERKKLRPKNADGKPQGNAKWHYKIIGTVKF